ncbi:CvfB family protein [Desulfotomaculum sp. 1211_IL3151]|uniref:CvfB family protein n=1 Tax=Desulfotomaculum sp. 1211_IL3151 TaxID=3084055 RepID=UPI002FDA3B92
MIQIGKVHKLQVTGKSDCGVHLADENEKGLADILLPKNDLPGKLEIGDTIDVFIYQDLEGKTLATVRKPKLTIGELGFLKVVEITSFGAFLDWGMPKDLLLPLKEQVGVIRKGDFCLVGLYINNSNKICASMRIYNLLSSDSPYKVNDRVYATVYSINEEIGAFVAVDDTYHGLIHKNELHRNYTVGDQVELRVKKVREDGKLELSFRDKAYNEIETDAQMVMERLKSGGGILRINDNSSPEQIKAELNISKRAFKRAVGRLLKEGAIKTTEEGIEAMW